MRLFIAIDFDEFREYFISLQDKIPKDSKLSLTKTYHLTLKFLGDVEDNNIDKIKENLKKIAFKPYSVDLDKIGFFPSENYMRVIWIGIDPKKETIELQDQIERSLKEFKFKKDFEFHPHITLARVKFVKDKINFIETLKKIGIVKKPVKVNNFKLIKSTLTPNGPVYEDLEVYKCSAE